MDIGALLKAFIYLAASSLLYPVLLLLVVMTLWMLVYSGTFCGEWLERRRMTGFAPANLPDMICAKQDRSRFPRRIRNYLDALETLIRQDRFSEVRVENLLQDAVLKIWKSMDMLRIFVRVAPGLGLIGTLIPMGTGLAALGQGDMTRLTGDLVIAFTTTVVGLAIGMLAFFFYTIRRRWAEEDIRNMEIATDLLAGEQEGR